MASRHDASPLNDKAVSPLTDIALRWSNLADRRLAYYISLYESGRWRHYYDERQFLARIRDVKRAATEWDRLSSGSALTTAPTVPAAPRRTAA
jgi:uncharacterized repeat protein (TIGR03809 family)